MLPEVSSRAIVKKSFTLAGSFLYSVLAGFTWLGFTFSHAVAQGFNGGSVTFGEAFHISGCRNIFAVAGPTGYSVILWVGGAPVLDRDLLSGNLKTVGQATLINHTRKQSTMVYVEQSYLSLQAFRSLTARGCPS